MKASRGQATATSVEVKRVATQRRSTWLDRLKQNVRGVMRYPNAPRTISSQTPK